MKTYDEFTGEWNGRQVTKFGGQCVALIAEFESENNYPIVWGDAVQWENNPVMFSTYNWIPNNPNDPNQLPNRGDIIVWDGRLPYTNGAGHIAFFDHNMGNHQLMSFGQNSGGPTAHFQPHSWDYVAGWWTSKVAAPPPAPVHPCTYEATNEHIMRTKLQPTNWYNLNNTTWSALANNPVRRLEAGTSFTVGGYAYNNTAAPGEKYAMTPEDFARAQRQDYSTNNGINVKDLEDIPAPPPSPPAPSAPPTAPLPFPSRNEPYTVVDTIKGYPTANSAINDIKATGPVGAGKYFVYNTHYGMINVTKTPGRPGSWINPAENVRPPSQWDKPVVAPEPTPAPVPEPVAAPVVVAPTAPQSDTTWKKLSPLTTTRYISTNLSNITIHDINGKGPDTTLEPNTELEILFTFDRDGVRYGMTRKAYQYKSHSDNWYGVPMSIVRIDSVYDTATTVAERLYLRNAKFGDHVGKALHNIEQFVQVIDGILKTRKVKK